MMKKMLFMFVSCFLLGAGVTHASLLNATPEEFLDRVVDTANSNFKNQKTQLDDVSSKSVWGSQGKMKITGTLGNIVAQIEPYLQWITFIGMTVAVILLTRNGFKLVMNSSGMVEGGDMKTVKENIKNILTGVLILTGFIVIIRLIMAIINFFFAQ